MYGHEIEATGGAGGTLFRIHLHPSPRGSGEESAVAASTAEAGKAAGATSAVAENGPVAAVCIETNLTVVITAAIEEANGGLIGGGAPSFGKRAR